MRRAGATGRLLLRFDSGFWNNDLMETIEANDGWFSVGIRMQTPIVAAIETIDDHAWVDIGARAQVAETVYDGRRLTCDGR